jgi:hypothetical protein
MMPLPEQVHWLFASGFLALGLFLLAEAIVGREVWRKRRWRTYLWPSMMFAMGLGMWPVMVFFTSSTLHMLAHGAWAEVMMLAGAAELGLASGKLQSSFWRLAIFLAFAVTGAAFLVHEQNGWFFQRSSFLHHLMGWTFLGASVFPLGRAFRPPSVVFSSGVALAFVAVAVMLFSDRDVAPIFGHLSPLAGPPHR